MSGRPYRLSPRTLDGDELQGHPPYEDVRDQMAQLGSHTLRDAPRQLYRWAEHPDERVLLDLVSWALPPFVDAGPLEEHLADRALREAHLEGRAWTPLIDALDASAAASWNAPSSERSGRLGRVDFDDLLDDLEDWIRAQDDPASLRPLLEFSSITPTLALAREARPLDEDLLQALLARTRQAPAHLLENSSFGSREAALVRCLLLDHLGGQRSIDGTAAWTDQVVARTILQLHEHGHPLVEAERGWCLELLETDAARDGVLHLATTLGDHLSSEWLEAAYDRLPPEEGRALIDHPSVSLPLHRRALEDASGHATFKLRVRYAQDEHLRSDPVIGDDLLQSTSLEVLRPLLTDEDPGLRRRALERMMDEDLEAVVDLCCPTPPDASGRKRTRRNLDRWRLGRHSGMIGRAVASTGKISWMRVLLHELPGEERPRELLEAVASHPEARTHDLARVLTAARGDPFRVAARRLLAREPERGVALLEQTSLPGLEDLSAEDLQAVLLEEGSKLPALLARELPELARKDGPGDALRSDVDPDTLGTAVVDELVDRALDHEGLIMMRNLIRHVPAAARRSELREAMRTYPGRALQDLVALCRDAGADEFLELFSEILERAPQRAVTVLEEGPERFPALSETCSEVLLLLLRHDDAKVRQGALLAARTLDASEQAEPQRSRSR